MPLDKGVSFLEKIKQFANLHLHHNYHPNQDQVSKLPDFDGVEALNNLGLGQDTESEHLAQMPAEDADKFMNQLNKPPPKDDDEEEVENFKVEGGGSDSLHVIEKNPLASFLKGVKGLGKQHHEPEGPMPLGKFQQGHRISGLLNVSKLETLVKTFTCRTTISFSGVSPHSHQIISCLKNDVSYPTFTMIKFISSSNYLLLREDQNMGVELLNFPQVLDRHPAFRLQYLFAIVSKISARFIHL